MKDIKAQHEANLKSSQILIFLQNKYHLDSSNLIIETKNIYNAI